MCVLCTGGVRQEIDLRHCPVSLKGISRRLLRFWSRLLLPPQHWCSWVQSCERFWPFPRWPRGADWDFLGARLQPPGGNRTQWSDRSLLGGGKNPPRKEPTENSIGTLTGGQPHFLLKGKGKYQAVPFSEAERGFRVGDSNFLGWGREYSKKNLTREMDD